VPGVPSQELDSTTLTNTTTFDAHFSAHSYFATFSSTGRGALLGRDAVDIRLADQPATDLPVPDAAFTQEVRALLGAYAAGYAVSVLDLSNPAAPRCCRSAARSAAACHAPGSA
jgi:hypothetical protein